MRYRTTNGLDRLDQELKRCTRVVRIFPHRPIRLWLATALAVEQSEEWVSGPRFVDVEPLREAQPAVAPLGVIHRPSST